MKRAILLLLLFSFCFSTFGQSYLRLERTWTIEGEGNYSFDGALAVNNSNQRIVSITTLPKMEIVSEKNNIRVRFNGSEKTLQATAIIAVDYNTNITQDRELETVNRQLDTTNLTAWNPAIRSAAKKMESNSSLETIRNLTVFVNNYLEYNESCYGEVYNATKVFEIKQGVCVEYSHLLISMANSLGFQARYVSGYAKGQIWEPHAWVEIHVPGYGYIPADPTFIQMGILDSSHVAIGTGEDQSAVYDSIDSESDLNISFSDNVRFINQISDPKGLGILHTFNETSGTLDIVLLNSRQEYVFAPFQISLPEEFGIEENHIILLKPSQNHTFRYLLNISDLEKGYSYTIPVTATLGDSQLNSSLVIEREEDQAQETSDSSFCIPAAALILIVLYVFHQK